MKKINIILLLIFCIISGYAGSSNSTLHKKPENRKAYVYAPFNFELKVKVKWKEYKNQFKNHSYSQTVKQLFS